MLPPESAGMWLGDGLTRGKGAWLGDVRRKKGDPRRWARVRRESRPLPRTPLRCTRPAMTQQGVVRGRSSGDLHVRHDHVNADGARAASTKRARLEGGNRLETMVAGGQAGGDGIGSNIWFGTNLSAMLRDRSIRACC